MATSEERMQILEMVASGKITAEEGSRLLRALEKGSQPAETRSAQPRMLKIRITDLATGKDRVNVSIPMSLVNVGMKMGARFAPEIEGVNLDEVMVAIRHGAHGRIVDVTDEEEGERVEIFVE